MYICGKLPTYMDEKLYKAIEQFKGIPAPYAFMADNRLKALDMIIRTFCHHSDLTIGATVDSSDFPYIMEANHMRHQTVGLNDMLNIGAADILSNCTSGTRMILLSRPNMTVGTSMPREEVEHLLTETSALVVIDERLGDFSKQRAMRFEVAKYSNLIVLSHPGIIFANPQLIARLDFLKPLYGYSKANEDPFADQYELDSKVLITLQERGRMMEAFHLLPSCQQVFSSEAPFFTVRMRPGTPINETLREYDCHLSPVPGYHDFYVVPVSSRTRNNSLIGALRQIPLKR